MKKMTTILLLGVLATTCCFSQAKADDIIGYYLAHDPKTKDNVQMEIYKTSDGKYEGKVVWVANKQYSDKIGTVQIKNLEFNSKNEEWEKGRVWYEGREYKLYAAFDEPKKLKLRGYFGVSLLGKTMHWDKESDLRK